MTSNQIPIIIKEFIHCKKDREVIEIEECRKCGHHKKHQRIGLNLFVTCEYRGDEE